MYRVYRLENPKTANSTKPISTATEATLRKDSDRYAAASTKTEPKREKYSVSKTGTPIHAPSTIQITGKPVTKAVARYIQKIGIRVSSPSSR
jgi:hypothetical protein